MILAEAAIYRIEIVIDLASATAIAAPIAGVLGWFTRSLLNFMQKTSADQLALVREVVTATVTTQSVLSQVVSAVQEIRPPTTTHA